MSRLNRFLLFLFILILLGNGITVEWIRRQNIFFLDFIDIGQGDSALLQYRGNNIVIDGGDRPQETGRTKKSLCQFLSSQGVHKIDLMFLSHPHADHLGGLLEILKTWPVAMVLQSTGEHTTLLYRQFTEMIKRKNIPMITATEGMRISLGENEKKLEIEVLSPPLDGEEKDLDSQSLVLRVSYGKHHILFTGDIKKEFIKMQGK